MNDQKKVKVVIPIYQSNITYMEWISLSQCKKILGNYPICIIKPRKISLQIDEIKGVEIIDFDDEWFYSVQTYNDLMLSEQFYEQFLDYEYVLIYQLDAFVFEDKLHDFCEMNYDYIGAPWLYGQFSYINGVGGYYYVGNGGLSLRKVKTHLDILKKNKFEYTFNEDSFFSSMQSENFQVAPVEVALKFAFETNVRKCFKKNQSEMPFGCHAWHKYDFSFFSPYFKNAGYEVDSIQDQELDKKKYDRLCDFSQISEDDFKRVLNRLLSQKVEEVWVWGSGKIGKECGWLLQKNHIKIKGYLDKNVQLHGRTLYDSCIMSTGNYWNDLDNIPVIFAMNPVPEEVIVQLKKRNKKAGWNYICWDKLKAELEEVYLV